MSNKQTKQQNQPHDHLVTQSTSPLVVKKAFAKLGHLLTALVKNIDQPLPQKQKITNLDAQGLRDLSKRLSHAITKYVLFICQEGSIKTIESQTTTLLTHIRSMCNFLRSKLDGAGPTLTQILIHVGTAILLEIKQLTSDLSDEVSVQWKKCLNSRGKFVSPLDDEESKSQIVLITGRIWASCEKLHDLPLTDCEAVAYRMKSSISMIKDAYKELGKIEVMKPTDVVDTETSSEPQDTEIPTLVSADSPQAAVDAMDEEEAMLLELEKELNMMAIDAVTPQIQSTEVANDQTLSAQGTSGEPTRKLNPEEQFFEEFGDLADLDDSTDYYVTKDEYKWVKHGRSIIKVTSTCLQSIIHLIRDMKHPQRTDSGEFNLKATKAPAEYAAFVETLERRKHDVDKISEYIDNMCEALYSPQNIVVASKYAFYTISKLSRLLLWLDIYYQKGYFSHIADSRASDHPLYPLLSQSETDTSEDIHKAIFEDYITKIKEKKSRKCTSDDTPRLLDAHYWFSSITINPHYRPATSMQHLDPKSEQYKRVHEFDELGNHPKISSWKYINDTKRALFLACILDHSLVEQHLVYRGSDELIDDRTDDMDADEDYGDYDYEDEDEDDDYDDEDEDDDDFDMIIY